MPKYEYRCGACGHELEVTQRISDPPMIVCPACSQGQLERLVSSTSFALRGGGWYADGYGGGEKKNGSTSSSASKPEGAASDAKPAADPKPAAADPKPTSSTT